MEARKQALKSHCFLASIDRDRNKSKEVYQIAPRSPWQNCPASLKEM